MCKPEESKMWFDKLWQNTVDLFRSLDIPVRTLECCSGDLADLKVKSIDVEAWSPRQKKYFEVGSCSNLGDAQARRLKIRVQDENKKKYFAHTLNNTVVAPPRMLIAFLENNLQADGSVKIPKVLQPYGIWKDRNPISTVYNRSGKMLRKGIKMPARNGVPCEKSLNLRFSHGFVTPVSPSCLYRRTESISSRFLQH